jgi:C_GCAxxG_C_C family probable redox protein
MASTSAASERAREIFLSGYNCAQAVVGSHAAALGLDTDIALKAACAFGAGMARQQEICGAVSGGLLVLGLRSGRGKNETRDKTEDTYVKARSFMEKFKASHGSLCCRDLVACDLRTPEGQAYYKAHDLLHQTCEKCVITASTLVGSD